MLKKDDLTFRFGVLVRQKFLQDIIKEKLQACVWKHRHKSGCEAPVEGEGPFRAKHCANRMSEVTIYLHI